MKSILAVLFTYVLAQLSIPARAYDVRYKGQLLTEHAVRVALRTYFHLELKELTIGGAKLTVKSRGHVYGFRKAECMLLPIQGGRKHVAVNCKNDFGGSEGKRLEGAIFDVRVGPDFKLIFSEFELYAHARKLTKRRLLSAEVTPQPIPIALLEGSTDAECSINIVQENLELNPCFSQHGYTPRLEGQFVPGVYWGFDKFAPAIQ